VNLQPEAYVQNVPDDAQAGPPAESADLAPEIEPVTTGTLFILVIFLMALAGLWGIMYLTLLGR
jgi:hypothetical protein